MSERGESLGAVKMLKVVSWLKLRARRNEHARGLGLSAVRQPNRRVQRTRAARFARIGSPLTRYPLGGQR